MQYDVFISYNTCDKLIADAVCHYIESRRLRCFIAPRDIKESDWAGSITNAIENARAFVIVVSEHSLASNEVAKEITLATQNSSFIFPFRIDESELKGRMKYHLSAFHWIDAVTPPMEQRLEELADRVAHALQSEEDNYETEAFVDSVNRMKKRLIGKPISPRGEFIGRTKELDQIDELFASGEHAVFLCGMGGIGKSEIAKAFAKRHAAEFTTAVFASYQTDLLHLIASDQAIRVENLKQASAAGGQGESTQDYYDRKMDVLRGLVDEHTLIIIDNFDVEDDEKLADVMDLPCKLIFTSRTDFSSMGMPTVQIGPMDNFEDLFNLFQKIVDKTYTKEEDKQAVRDIIHLLDCHTYAVSLTAAQMKAGFIKPQKMLSQLQEEGLNIKTRSVFSHNTGDAKSTAYQYMQALFDFSKLDDAALEIMRYLACMPREGVEVELFLEVCDVDDFADIRRLIDLNWVQMDTESERIALHMLVKELVWEKITPTLSNCEKLINGAYGWAFNAWNKSNEENTLHSNVIYAVLEAFPEPEFAYLDQFEDMATFAWIMGRFDLSERCELKNYQLCVDHEGELSVIAGKQALRVAAVYHNQGDYAKARPWYEKGLKVQEAIDPESFEAYIARGKVARSDAQSGNIESAYKLFQYNLEIMERIRDAAIPEGGEFLRKRELNFAYAHQNMAHILVHLGRSEEALYYAQVSYDYFKDEKVEPSLVIYAMMVMAYVHYGLKDYQTAYDWAARSLEENLYYRGEDRIDIMFLHEMLGDLLCLMERYDEACEEYETTIGGREKFFPSDVKSLKQLEEKLACAQEGRYANLPFQDTWT